MTARRSLLSTLKEASSPAHTESIKRVQRVQELVTSIQSTLKEGGHQTLKSELDEISRAIEAKQDTKDNGPTDHEEHEACRQTMKCMKRVEVLRNCVEEIMKAAKEISKSEALKNKLDQIEETMKSLKPGVENVNSNIVRVIEARQDIKDNGESTQVLKVV